MKLVLISDTHGFHRELDVPAGDVLIHAGDLTRRGDLDEVVDFADWLGELPHPHKLVIAGNHDWCFERDERAARRALGNATYLQDEAVEIDGLKFWGSPWQPRFLDFAFNLDRGAPLAEKWSLIPEDTDVLITHGPPNGILDATSFGERVGCEELAKRVEVVTPKVHVFGHIHEARGRQSHDGTIFVNACTDRGFKPGFVVEI